MGFQPYYTHVRSRLDTQPAEDNLGNLLCLDGRLDNHRELRSMLDIADDNTPGSAIMLAAFGRWGDQSFTKFVGDWALALWSKVNQSLYLARDHAGTRSLYFEEKEGDLRWSTFLETFFNEPAAKSVDETYLAAFLLGQQLQGLTPYATIHAVPAAHYVVFESDGAIRNGDTGAAYQAQPSAIARTANTKSILWRCSRYRLREEQELESRFSRS